jgi:2-keto-3-deoxy-L-rhamnonate aldolase RhmA
MSRDVTNLGGRLKAKLATGPCFGTFAKLGRPEVAEILALAGFDFLICDMEHAPVTEREAREFIRASVAMDVPVVVRLPEPTPGLVNRLLEAGSVGIQMPRLRTSAEVRSLRSMMMYPPAGRRSYGSANLLGGYGSVAQADYIERANARMLTVGQFETREVEEPIGRMIEGLDVAFIGPADLSLDFGFGGKFDAPLVTERMKAIESAVAGTGTVMGIAARNAAATKRYLEAGYRFLAVGNDVGTLSAATRGIVAELKDLVSELPRSPQAVPPPIGDDA